MYGYYRYLALFTVGFLLFINSCSDTSTAPDDNNPRIPEFNSQAAPGDSARSFLTDNRFSVLNVEIDYMEGYEPTQQALDSLKPFLETYLHKSSINIELPTSIAAGGQNAYSANEVRALEQQHRNHYTDATSDTLWAYFIILDGEFTQQNVLGIAYFNTSMAFFGPSIDDVSGGIGQDQQWEVEGVAFRHEFGHILGLVNSGTPMQQDHQDEANGKHCDVEDCLMYYQVNTSDFFANTMRENLRDLDPLCRNDLTANGGKE